MQLNHYSTSFTKRKFPITLVCENVTNAPNIGSLFRTADAFGIEKIVFCGDHIPLGRKMTKTSRATEKSVCFEVSNNAEEIATKLKSYGYQIIALEITSTSKSLYTHQFSINQPIALIIGDENFGVSETLLNLCDNTIHIEMFGQNSSMNVVQATSITLYEITKQFL
ncbi:TrmH family RNA methyltransferase [Psychroserpens ponticola]|uniref:TrmH family RNA methyltransferase n=1 Tax=Psychroserpens ponticola TaxID=2932268 RepID=A0ABY7RU71_9FLAO|nr:TrmH family RNA methyltransferase [Psychroserpens ponticola]WCO00373.1 TrmH family RNA methyltransferase [Psychroserpens ponticola]